MANERQPIVIEDFVGQSENAHIGAGVYVGIDLFTTKTVARLSRKMLNQSAGVITGLPVYISESNQGYLYVQDENGKVYVSVDQGMTWAVLAGNTGTDGKGLVIWQDYVWAFFGSGVDLYGPLSSGSPSWTNGWTPFTVDPLVSQADVNHFPIPSPLANAYLYIANNHYIAQVQVITFPFNPGGIPGTDFQAISDKFVMQDYYNAKCIGFLPTSNIAIGCANRLNNSQADVVIWDGSADTGNVNTVNIPGASGPVTQVVTRNGICYCVTDQEHGVYTVNGSSAQLVDRISLRMSNRLTTGEQFTTRVTPHIYPSAIDFLGPELLTGNSNFPSLVTQISGTGMYPYGIWSVNIENSNISTSSTGTYGVCTRFPLSHGVINANYDTEYTIGLIKVLTGGVVIAGWKEGNTYGIDRLDPANYITDPSTVVIETSLYELGTRKNPRTFNTMEYNLVAPLNPGEEMTFYFRTSQSSPYTIFNTETSATLANHVSDVITPLPFQNVIYIQFMFRLNASTTTNNLTPQLNSVLLT